MFQKLTSKIRTKIGRAPETTSEEFRSEKAEFKQTRTQVKRLLGACSVLETASLQYSQAVGNFNDVIIDVSRTSGALDSLGTDFVRLYEEIQQSVLASQRRQDTAVVNLLSAPLMTMRQSITEAKALLEKFYVAVDEQKSVEKTLKSVSAKKHRGDATRKLNNASEAHATSVTALAHLEQRVLHDMASIREAKSQLVMESLCQLLQRQRQHYEYAHTKYNAQDALISGALDRTQETRQEITDVQMQRTTGVLEAGRFADHTAGKLDFDSLCEGGNLVPSTEEPHLFGGENTLLRVDRVVSLNVLALGMNVEGTSPSIPGTLYITDYRLIFMAYVRVGGGRAGSSLTNRCDDTDDTDDDDSGTAASPQLESKGDGDGIAGGRTAGSIVPPPLPLPPPGHVVEGGSIGDLSSRSSAAESEGGGVFRNWSMAASGSMVEAFPQQGGESESGDSIASRVSVGSTGSAGPFTSHGQTRVSCWEAVIDVSSQYTYYFNSSTGETTWIPPVEILAAQDGKGVEGRGRMMSRRYSMHVPLAGFSVPIITIARHQKTSAEVHSSGVAGEANEVSGNTLSLWTEDLRAFKLSFAGSNVESSEILGVIAPLMVNDMENTFALRYHRPGDNAAQPAWDGYDVEAEWDRMGGYTSMHWRLSEANRNYDVCPTYPPLFGVPALVPDSDLTEVAMCRTKQRLPVCCWMRTAETNSGVAVEYSLVRCSQPLMGKHGMGLSGTTVKADVGYLENFGKRPSCPGRRLAGSDDGAALSDGDSTSGPLSMMGGSGRNLLNKLGGSGRAVSGSRPASDPLTRGGIVVQTSAGAAGGSSPARPASIKQRLGGRSPDSEGGRPQLVIFDARPRVNALGNVAKGGGFETQNMYPFCKVVFLGIANIHAVREAFVALHGVVASTRSVDAGWHALQARQGSDWLTLLSTVMVGSLRVAEALMSDQDGSAASLSSRCAVVHCSDGWDRTAQLCATAQLLLDPYYRSLAGFQVLVEKEWCSFGHKFAQRCGHHEGKTYTDKQRSPVFVQWLDCVWQLLHQFPNEFGFNALILSVLFEQVYSCRFGNFLGNSSMARSEWRNRTRSLWEEVNGDKATFVNTRWKGADSAAVLQLPGGMLRPACDKLQLKLWPEYRRRWNVSTAMQDPVTHLTGRLLM